MKKIGLIGVLLALAAGTMSTIWMCGGESPATVTVLAADRSTAIVNTAATGIAPALLGAADEYGTIKGRFVLDGAIPELPPKMKKGNPAAKDAVCMAQDIPDESLVVDEKSKGIANIFLYLPKATKIHPDLKSSKEKSVTFDNKECRFVPHGLFVRTDQVVKVISSDPINHNTKTNPLRNEGINQSISNASKDGVPYKNPRAEKQPIPVECSIHPWMKAYWLILDHPYAVVSGPDGSFTLDKVPAGNHEFAVWQERSGYLDRKLKVTVKPGETADLGEIKIPVAKFEVK